MNFEPSFGQASAGIDSSAMQEEGHHYEWGAADEGYENTEASAAGNGQRSVFAAAVSAAANRTQQLSSPGGPLQQLEPGSPTTGDPLSYNGQEHDHSQQQQHDEHEEEPQMVETTGTVHDPDGMPCFVDELVEGVHIGHVEARQEVRDDSRHLLSAQVLGGGGKEDPVIGAPTDAAGDGDEEHPENRTVDAHLLQAEPTNNSNGRPGPAGDQTA